MPEISEEQLAEFTKSAAAVTDLTTQLEKVNSKNTELLGEKKSAQRKAAEAEEATRLKAEEGHKASSNFEELHKSSEIERNKTLDELTNLQASVATEKRNSAATTLAATLADGENVGLLSTFIGTRLKHVDGEIKVLDQSGALTVSTLSDLAKEFQGDARYASLLKGNKSSGGSANGGKKGNGVANEIARADFDALNHVDRMKFSQSGGTITDN